MENCNLYLAKIVGCGKEGDNRLQIRVLPYMDDSTEIGDDQCPKWPFFFKDELYIGTYGELVWCIGDDHFNVGYVLGPANYYTNYSSSYSTATKNNKEVILSPSQEKLLSTISNNITKVGASNMGAESSDNFSMNNMKVTFWSDSCIHFIDRDNGGFIIAYSSGSLLVMTPFEFFVHINTESGKPESGPTLKLDSNGISTVGESIKLQSEDIGLGKNPMGNILTTEGTTAEGGRPSSSSIKA